jgi:hypothetical protein
MSSQILFAAVPLCVLSMASCLGARQPQAQPRAWSSDVEQALAKCVDPARAQQHVRELVALGPRMGGTASGDRAAEYLAKTFRDAGASEVRVIEDPEHACHAEKSWHVVARITTDVAHEEFNLRSAWPYGFSPTSSGTVKLATDDAAGVAWLTSKPTRAASAAAVVLVDGATTLDGAYPVVQHLREGAKAPSFGLSKGDGDALRGWLRGGAQVEIEFALDAEIAHATPKTVVATIAGRNGKNPAGNDYFLFCAHGDSDAGGPGADDNASGVATLIEIVAAWSQAVREGAAPPPAYEIRVAAWGSEIHSTDDYVAKRVPGDGKLLGVINYDQSGFGSGADQVNIEPDDLPGNELLVRTLLAVLADRAPKDSTKPGAFPAHWATNKSLGGTDSYCFSACDYFKTNKLPAVTVFTSAWGKPEDHPRTNGMRGESWRERDQVSVDFDNYYHSAGDTPANTTDKEPWNMAWCARVGMLGAGRYLEGLR